MKKLEDWLGLTADLMKAYVPPSAAPARRIAMMLTVKSALDGQNLAAELARLRYTQIEVEKMRLLLRKRWRVIGRSPPVAFTTPGVQEWVRATYRWAEERGAEFEGWAPTEDVS